jgi:hypothetical protein
MPIRLAILTLAVVPTITAVSIKRGEALYNGKESLQAQIRGHDDLLPPEAVRCANCHSPQTASRLSGKPLPPLDAAFLLEPRQRRGGPPSSYDQSSFCKLLRTGTDPAYILIAREMPIYTLDDSQCASLWDFLTAKGPAK